MHARIITYWVGRRNLDRAGGLLFGAFLLTCLHSPANRREINQETGLGSVLRLSWGLSKKGAGPESGSAYGI